jgi:hypothetical protein
MSMHPTPAAPVPEETARVAHAAFPRGNAWIGLRDTVGPIYDDACFAPLFARRGRPAQAPWRLALVTVMQFAEGLSDRQAAGGAGSHRLEIHAGTGVNRSRLRLLGAVRVPRAPDRRLGGAPVARAAAHRVP